MKLVWLFDPSTCFERAWIHELLGHLAYDEVVCPDHDSIYENACLVVNHSFDYENYLQIYEDERIDYGVIHLSDETLGDTCNYLDHVSCKFAFRNYHHPIHSSHPKVTTFGLGYKSGFERVLCDQEGSHEPWFHWCFAGAIHNQERKVAVETFELLQPYLLFDTGNLFNTGGLDLSKYRMLFHLSKFALCPIGQCNIDTFRFYECLEAHCIPVVLVETDDQPYAKQWGYGSYWEAMFPGWEDSFPWIQGETWDECLYKAQEILHDPVRYHNLRVKASSFWMYWKKRWATLLQDACSTHLVV